MIDPSREALERWADDEYLVGHLLGVMLHGHLDLEEAVAMGSFAQDELSHASLVCGLMGEDERAKDRRFLLREPEDFLCSSLAAFPVRTWVEVIAKQVLYEEAERLRVTRLAGDTVIVREEEYHRQHWWAWATALCRSEVGRTGLSRSLAGLWPNCADLFDMGVEGLDARDWARTLEERLGAIGLQLPGELRSSRQRRQRSADAQARLEAIIAPSQAVFRQDPTAVWA